MRRIVSWIAASRGIASCTAMVFLSQACMAHNPPPPPPAPIVPKVENVPTTPSPEGSTRVIVDANERSRVARQLEAIESTFQPYGFQPMAGASYPQGATVGQHRTELLCITPCVADLPRGAYTLVFTSVQDNTRTSTGDVVVSSEPIALRHALGRSKPPSDKYFAGLGLTLVGGGLTTIGAFATTVGLVAKSPRDDPTGRTQGDDPKVFLGVGLVMLGLGLALGTTGLVFATGDRPVQQPGSTIQWTLPAPASGSETSVQIKEIDP